MQDQIRAIILGLSILGAAWLLHDLKITVDHIVVMESMNDANTTTESTDSDWYTENQARHI